MQALADILQTFLGHAGHAEALGHADDASQTPSGYAAGLQLADTAAVGAVAQAADAPCLSAGVNDVSLMAFGKQAVSQVCLKLK